MKIKASAGMLVGGLVAFIVGVVMLFLAPPAHAFGVIGPLVAFGGLLLFLVGLYRLAHNVDLAAATIVDGPEAAQRLYQGRDVRLQADVDD